jgi:hypothetical protein
MCGIGRKRSLCPFAFAIIHPTRRMQPKCCTNVAAVSYNILFSLYNAAHVALLGKLPKILSSYTVRITTFFAVTGAVIELRL